MGFFSGLLNMCDLNKIVKTSNSLLSAGDIVDVGRMSAMVIEPGGYRSRCVVVRRWHPWKSGDDILLHDGNLDVESKRVFKDVVRWSATID